METGNSMSGGMMTSGMGAGMLGLEMPLHPQPHNHNQHQHQHQHQQHRLLPFSAQPHDADNHPQQQPIRNAYAPCGGRGKQQQVSLSPEEEHGFGGDEAGVAVDGPKRGFPQSTASPWQRMKWTDTMVRLLITVVYCVEDEGGGGVAEGGDHHHPSSGKANSSTNNNNNNVKKVGSAQQQQKKGKWKSVSRAMLERGYYVSPQQCEDKFNDLNKRYKRVNELLGRGTACRVVENQALLDTMDLFPKAKEEARKLLNSKHLFFREMCAYHNSGSSCAPSLLPPPPAPQPPPDQLQSQQQHLHCLHHPPGDGGAADRDENHPDDDEDDMEHEDEDDDNYEDEDDVDDVEEDEDHDNKHGQHHQRHRHEEGDEDEDSKGFMAAVTSNAWSGVKRPRKKSLPSSASPPMSLSLSSPPSSVSMQQLRCELMGMAAGGGEQQRQWLRRRASELEEHRMGYQRRALELERQRFKWLRFSGNKEREMERMKLENERLRLDNERMLLLLRRKELELISVGEGGASSSAPTADPHHQQPNARRLGEYYSTAPSGGEHVSNAAG